MSRSENEDAVRSELLPVDSDDVKDILDTLDLIVSVEGVNIPYPYS